MAKKVLLLGLFCSFFIGFFQILAASNQHPVEHLPRFGELCSAPAPDSFRVTSTNGSIISLAWQPISIGAQHTLKVFEKDTSGNWNQIQAFYYITGGSFDVSSMQYGQEYRFVIATNCNNGETSELNSSIDFINLILDLTLAGRTPTNPAPLEGCPLVNYQINNWVGFSIQAPASGGTLATKYFEFAEGLSPLGDPMPIIKRNDAIWLVASDDDLQFPRNPAPQVVHILGSYTFKVYHIKGFPFPHLVGKMRVEEFNPVTKTVKICKVLDGTWDTNYSLTILTATSANGFDHTIYDSRNEVINLNSNNKIYIQSPFTNSLNINFQQESFEQEEIIIQLLHTSGQILKTSFHDSTIKYVSLNVDSIANGLYILRVKINGKNQIFKVIKTG